MKKLLMQWLIHDNNHKLSIYPHRMGGVLPDRESLKKSMTKVILPKKSNNFRNMSFHVKERS